jgi:hypothetical protein
LGGERAEDARFDENSGPSTSVGPMRQWDAEIEVDEALARALIRKHYPRLDTRSLRLLGIGWDNTVWATGHGIAFRFPRREITVPGITREMALLPHLAPRLPYASPDGAYQGAAGPLFPWPWLPIAWLRGRRSQSADSRTMNASKAAVRARPACQVKAAGVP